jgi:hypothetical protein
MVDLMRLDNNDDDDDDDVSVNCCFCVSATFCCFCELFTAHI